MVWYTIMCIITIWLAVLCNPRINTLYEHIRNFSLFTLQARHCFNVPPLPCLVLLVFALFFISLRRCTWLSTGNRRCGWRARLLNQLQLLWRDDADDDARPHIDFSALCLFAYKYPKDMLQILVWLPSAGPACPSGVLPARFWLPCPVTRTHVNCICAHSPLPSCSASASSSSTSSSSSSSSYLVVPARAHCILLDFICRGNCLRHRVAWRGACIDFIFAKNFDTHTDTLRSPPFPLAAASRIPFALLQLVSQVAAIFALLLWMWQEFCAFVRASASASPVADIWCLISITLCAFSFAFLILFFPSFTLIFHFPLFFHFLAHIFRSSRLLFFLEAFDCLWLPNSFKCCEMFTHSRTHTRTHNRTDAQSISITAANGEKCWLCELHKLNFWRARRRLSVVNAILAEGRHCAEST